MRIIGHGIDLVSVARIRQMLDDHAARFLTRCFTPEEQAHGAGTPRHAEHLAARFAAKEAAMKALGTGLADGISWTDVEVHSENNGAPSLILTRRAAEVALVRGIDHWLVSLSHTDDHAIASVIAAAGEPLA